MDLGSGLKAIRSAIFCYLRLVPDPCSTKLAMHSRAGIWDQRLQHLVQLLVKGSEEISSSEFHSDQEFMMYKRQGVQVSQYCIPLYVSYGVNSTATEPLQRASCSLIRMKSLLI